MKVLLICSVLREGIGQHFGRKEQVAGGWIDGILNSLSPYNDLEISYVIFEKSKKDLTTEKNIKGINYIIVDYSSNFEIKKFFEQHKYDVIHLFGAEHTYVKDIYELLDYEKTLVYIQGIISEYAYYYKSNYNQYFENNNILFKIYMQLNKNKLIQQGIVEKIVYEKCKYITGRTDWDKAIVNKLCVNAKYFHLNETLRSKFYESANSWDINKIDKFNVFISQTNYPIKAAHMIVEIARIVKMKYPNVVFTICGHNLAESKTLPTKLKFSYASYIMKLIKENKLEDNIKFVGNQNQSEMIDRLLKSHAFLLASSIENSPNSLQEAMLLGVPCVCSYVGGVSSLVSNQEQCLLYPFEDPAQAAYQIIKIFQSDYKAINMSKEANKRIAELTDIKNNGRVLYDIYNYIVEDNKGLEI